MTDALAAEFERIGVNAEIIHRDGDLSTVLVDGWISSQTFRESVALTVLPTYASGMGAEGRFDNRIFRDLVAAGAIVVQA